MRRTRWTPAIWLACLTLGVAAPAAAQSRGSSALRGTVLTAGGEPVAGAEIVLRQDETGLVRSALTNDPGGFLFLLLPPGGPYTLTVRSLGYAEERREGLVFAVGGTEVVEIALRTEALELEGIDVGVARAEIFDRSRVGPVTVLDERLIESTPLLSRDLMDLAVLSPLVKTTDGGGFSVVGQNDRYNAILIDGIPGKDAFGLTAGGVPGGQAGAKLIPLDAVSQFEVLVAPFDVRLSGFTGGVMNAVTRTGTNRFAARASAVHRNERLIGDLRLPVGTVDAEGVERSLVAVSVGGPIVRDRVHFFASGELESRSQPPVGYNVGRDDPFLARLTEASANEARAVFQDRFGLDTGTPASYPLSQSLANLFARVDAQLSSEHRLSVRHVFARAENDESPNRLGFQPYGFASNGVLRAGTTNMLSAQLFSTLGEGISNELGVQLQTVSDRSDPVSDWPQVQVDLLSTAEETSLLREVRFGSSFLAQEADLSQRQARLTNTLSLVRGTSTYTLGVTGALHDIAHRYLPGARGEWVFDDIRQLQDNNPSRAQWTELADGEDPRLDFSVLEWGAFVQNEMSVRRGLTMRFGLRVDVPRMLATPALNEDVRDFFGFHTDRIPSGNLLLSPRWGFNWQSDGELRTQVRGGAGLFTGQLPYVWLANAFNDTGLRWATRLCVGSPDEGGAAPRFDPGATSFACHADQTPRLIRNVTVFDPGFRYPQDLKFSAAVDRELTPRLSGSLGFLFNKAINQVVLEELNLGQPSGVHGPLEGYGGDERQLFGRPVGGADGPPVVRPNLLDADHERVLRATNESEDVAFALTAELRGRISDRLAFQWGYTFSRAFDKMSLVSVDMVSNYGLNAVGIDPNRPPLRPSNFDRPHKVVFALYGAPIAALPGTEISILYTGQSGYPFSYVYGFDLNGDGYPGPGPAFERTNDLVYVPERSTQIPASVATYRLLEEALRTDACLSENVGRILQRNACRSPWQNQLDVRLSQRLALGAFDVRLEGDVVNALALVSDEWGRITTVRPATPLLGTSGRLRPCATQTCPILARWAGGAYRDAAGEIHPADAWYASTPESQWQIQLGARMTFGGNVP